MDDVILISSDPIFLDEAARLLGHKVSLGDAPGSDDEAGALVTFSGIVRRREGDGEVDYLDYEHYAGMAEKHLEKLLSQARAKWPIHRAAILHRVGRVPTAEPSVIIAVSAGHRAEAFEAGRYLIDELKKQVPIWKSAPNEDQ